MNQLRLFEGYLDSFPSQQTDECRDDYLDRLVSPLQNVARLDSQFPPKAINYHMLAIKTLVENNEKLHTDYGYKHIREFYTDEEFRNNVVNNCTDVSIIEVFHADMGFYNLLGDQIKFEHTEPILRVIDAYLKNVSAQSSKGYI